jgi:multicomponent Na+:H+ antiporter subunit E
MSGPIILAFGLWMLLTADFSWPNAVVGLLGAVMVSRLPLHRFSAWQLLCLLIAALVRLPQVLWESFLIVVLPHPHEQISTRKVRQPGNHWAVFCQTFIITFTPRSLVISEEDGGEVRLHSLERRKAP